jgi:hypothetical protein
MFRNTQTFRGWILWTLQMMKLRLSPRLNLLGKPPHHTYMDYIYRGPKRVHFCLYEYLSQIGICTRRSAPRGSFSFAAGHPKIDTHRQYSAKLRRPGSDGDGEIDGLWVPAIYGRLTGVNNRGDSADRILRDSQDVQHYIAEALLGLFVPWERLTPLFAKTLPMSPFSRNPEMLALQSGTISSPPFRRTYNDWP